MQQANLGLEGSRRSESTLGGCMTAQSEAQIGLGAVGHAPASPLASVQQRLRNFSGQSLSGFTDPGTPHSACGDGGEYLGTARAVDRGPLAFVQGAALPASQHGCGSSDMHCDRMGERPLERQGSGSSVFFPHAVCCLSS